jgi:hypothetical protein
MIECYEAEFRLCRINEVSLENVATCEPCFKNSGACTRRDCAGIVCFPLCAIHEAKRAYVNNAEQWRALGK